MTINNLSGNFYPPKTGSGKNLPVEGSGSPSTRSNDTSVSEKSAVNKLTLVPPSREESNTIQNGMEYPKKAANGELVNNQIEEYQQFNQSINRSIQFKIDEELGVTIVRVVDKETDELIRQFPPEELINLSKRLKEINNEGPVSSGILLQEKV